MNRLRMAASTEDQAVIICFPSCGEKIFIDGSFCNIEIYIPHDEPGFYSPQLSNHMMRSFFFSCAMLCATGLVRALPSAIFLDSLEDKHPIGKRQDSYLTADVQQPLDGDCVISDVGFSACCELSPLNANRIVLPPARLMSAMLHCLLENGRKWETVLLSKYKYRNSNMNICVSVRIHPT